MGIKIIDKTTFKFILVGILNTVVGAGIMFLFYNCFNFNYWISSASNYILGSILSYFLNKYYTFNKKEKSFLEIIKFIINISLCYLIAYGFAKPFVLFILKDASVLVRDNIAMLVGMGLFIILNYFGQKFLVFRERKEKANR